MVKKKKKRRNRNKTGTPRPRRKASPRTRGRRHDAAHPRECPPSDPRDCKSASLATPMRAISLLYKTSAGRMAAVGRRAANGVYAARWGQSAAPGAGAPPTPFRERGRFMAGARVCTGGRSITDGLIYCARVCVCTLFLSRGYIVVCFRKRQFDIAMRMRVGIVMRLCVIRWKEKDGNNGARTNCAQNDHSNDRVVNGFWLTLTHRW